MSSEVWRAQIRWFFPLSNHQGKNKSVSVSWSQFSVPTDFPRVSLSGADSGSVPQEPALPAPVTFCQLDSSGRGEKQKGELHWCYWKPVADRGCGATDTIVMHRMYRPEGCFHWQWSARTWSGALLWERATQWVKAHARAQTRTHGQKYVLQSAMVYHSERCHSVPPVCGTWMITMDCGTLNERPQNYLSEAQ